MGLFDFLRGPNINQGIKEFNETRGAVLLDVRNPDEYKAGHITKSKNIPLSSIEYVSKVVKDKDTPLFVYCYSGGRSSQAVAALKRMGYTKVINIGGISAYKGKVER